MVVVVVLLLWRWRWRWLQRGRLAKWFISCRGRWWLWLCNESTVHSAAHAEVGLKLAYGHSNRPSRPGGAPDDGRGVICFGVGCRIWLSCPLLAVAVIYTLPYLDASGETGGAAPAPYPRPRHSPEDVGERHGWMCTRGGALNCFTSRIPSMQASAG